MFGDSDVGVAGLPLVAQTQRRGASTCLICHLWLWWPDIHRLPALQLLPICCIACCCLSAMSHAPIGCIGYCCWWLQGPLSIWIIFCGLHWAVMLHCRLSPSQHVLQHHGTMMTFRIPSISGISWYSSGGALN